MARIVGFSTNGDGEPPPDPREMRRRLADPLEREQVRKEERVQVQARHPDIAAVLGIEAPLETRLIDLLTDQQLQHLDRFYSDLPPRVEVELRNKEQLRELLGEEVFERYLDYCTTLGERWQVAYFCARLSTADALTSVQKDQLLALLPDRDRIGAGQAAPSPPIFVPALEAYMRKRNIESSENAFRQMREDSQRLLQRLPHILTPRQLETYARMEEEKIARQREHVRQMRIEAGMSAEFDETGPAVRQSRPTLVEGQVRVEISLTVNGSETLLTQFQVANGKMAPGWRAPEGLWVEATPFVYTDGWMQAALQFYEERGERRRPLGGRLTIGGLTRHWERQGRGGARIGGATRTYNIWIQVRPSLISSTPSGGFDKPALGEP